MTKLEEDIWIAVNDEGAKRLKADVLYTEVDRAKAAAEVAKKYIEKAFDAGYMLYNEKFGELIYKVRSNPPLSYKTREEWLKENGVIE